MSGASSGVAGVNRIWLPSSIDQFLSIHNGSILYQYNRNAERQQLITDRTYAVAHPKGNFASGRAEEIILFYKILHIVQNFCKKE
jgi:hypothetical protein